MHTKNLAKLNPALISLAAIVSLGNIEPASAEIKLSYEDIKYEDLKLGETYLINGGIPAVTPPKSKILEPGKDYLLGVTQNKIDYAAPANPLFVQTQCGCDTTKFKTQYRVQGSEFLNVGNNGEKLPGYIVLTSVVETLPQEEFTLRDGTKATFDKNGIKDDSGVISHENKHVKLFQSFIKKIAAGLDEWAKVYEGPWFNNQDDAESKLKEDGENAFEKMKKDYFPKLDAWTTNSGHDEYVSYNDLEYFTIDKKRYFSLEDREEREDSGGWSKYVNKEINDFKDYAKYNTSKQGDEKIPCTPVPAPLPILGVGVFFKFSRTIRRRLNQIQ
jgi:hypothetical protein